MFRGFGLLFYLITVEVQVWFRIQASHHIGRDASRSSHSFSFRQGIGGLGNNRPAPFFCPPLTFGEILNPTSILGPLLGIDGDGLDDATPIRQVERVFSA